MNNPDHAEDLINEMWKNKEKIMGFGHRVYKNGDPRNPIIKDISKTLSQDDNNCWKDSNLYAISERVEKLMIDNKKIHPNLDFYSAST